MPRPSFRCFLSLVVMLISVDCTFSLCAAEADADGGAALKVAQRDVEMAQLRLRLYERVEYPTELRRLESSIQLAEAEAESLRRRVKEYQQFDKLSYSKPLFDVLERAKVALVAVELRLEDLQEEKLLLMRHRADRRRLLVLQLQAAIDRLTGLKGGK